jgi:AdoMet-dependent heme synthase
MDDGNLDSYQVLLARLRREYVPYSVMWELTHACNLKCVMCYNVPLPQPELSTGRCLDILEQLAAAGTLRLLFTGGEILTRRDFFVIAERARELGFALDLKTNGTLITSEVADKLAALRPVQVDLSLLGATPETFDTVAGSRRTLERVLQGVRLLQERHVRVRLNTLLLNLNVAEQRQMAQMALELNVEYQQVFKVSPADNRDNAAGRHQLSSQAMAEVLQVDQTPFSPKQYRATDRTCGVGLSSCMIDPYGAVYPCVELRIEAGNLHRQRFTDIWTSAPILRQLRANHFVGNLPECRECEVRNYCEGRCSGLAWKEHGDLYRGHTLACDQAQARFAQQHPGKPIPNSTFQVKRRPYITGPR